MKAQFTAITIEKPKVVRQQIADAVRELLLSGKLAPGERIPSTRALAATWGADVFTVHAALSALEKEGRLVRLHGKGTFVRQREKKLTCVAVYDVAGAFRESLFEQALQAALKEELTAAGIEIDVWLDPRPVAERGEPWRPLVKAAGQRKFQALITTSADLPRLSWQRRLPVPTAFLTIADIPNAVDPDHAQFAELGIRALAQQGCRSVGIISTLPTELSNPDGSRPIGTEFYGRLTDLIGDWGLTVKNEWMRVPPRRPHSGGRAQEEFGYREFLKLWSQPEKPAGLIVYPDTAARGVITAVLEKSVRVPAELKLVLHKNEAVNLLCPVPATFLISSERAMARALIEQVQKQFRGETCAPIKLSYRLLAHPAAEQIRGGAHRGNSQGRTNNQSERERSQS